MDSGTKVAGAKVAVDATGVSGFDRSQVQLLGIALLVATALYACRGRRRSGRS